jgi:hypothetical protein
MLSKRILENSTELQAVEMNKERERMRNREKTERDRDERSFSSF